VLIDDLVKWCSLTKPYLTSAPILKVSWKADGHWAMALRSGRSLRCCKVLRWHPTAGLQRTPDNRARADGWAQSIPPTSVERTCYRPQSHA
jgi:hypothetical protein